MNFSADVLISNKEGKVMASGENIPLKEIISRYENTELYLILAINQKVPFPPGEYIIQYFITDQNSGKNFEIVKNIKITT